jgi:hypothetical protein
MKTDSLETASKLGVATIAQQRCTRSRQNPQQIYAESGRYPFNHAEFGLP